MLEEQGRVVALEPGAVWVETMGKSTCSGCSARSGCGQGLMDRLGIRGRRGLVRALTDLELQPGSPVIIGIDEKVLLRGSLLVYLFPLLMLFTSALLVDQISTKESYVILAGLGGFTLSWLIVRLRSKRIAGDPALQPVVLRASLAGPAGSL